MSVEIGVLAVLLTVVTTVGVGAIGLRRAQTTSDFYVASRSVTPFWNASAIGGEYLSAASFLGVAGLILAYGADMLWFPVGYTAGYVLLLVLVAAPLRRSGAYTLPDFAEARLESRTVRRAASLLVVLIGWLYLLPQLHAAGLTLRTVTGAPGWVGPVAVAAVVVLTVTFGGMRSITFVQAFQYWLKLTAIAVPAIVLAMVWRADGLPELGSEGPATFAEATTVEITTEVQVRIDEPVSVTVSDPGSDSTAQTWDAGTREIQSGSTVTFPAGSTVPHADTLDPVHGQSWLTPTGSEGWGLYTTYSLILALFFGTMGLPHVLVRFYTNPDGRAARRTTLTVLALLGLFYLFPTVYGALGRLYAPELLFTGQADAVVLLLPGQMVPGLAGVLLSVLVVSGAFAAFLSTSSGLTVSIAGVLSQDAVSRRVSSPILAFRISAALALLVPTGFAILAVDLGIADVVGLAFAVAASTFCPLLLLGIWWRRLTDIGALVGLIVGGLASTVAVIATIAAGPFDGVVGALVAQPAAWTVPLTFAVMVAVSLLTPHRVAPDVRRTMVRLHTPEALRLDRGSGATGDSGRGLRATDDPTTH